KKSNGAPNGFYAEIDWDRYGTRGTGIPIPPESFLNGSPRTKGKHFYSSSESEEEEEAHKKFNIKIKPLQAKDVLKSAATVDELKASIGNIALSPSPVVSAATVSRRATNLLFRVRAALAVARSRKLAEDPAALAPLFGPPLESAFEEQKLEAPLDQPEIWGSAPAASSGTESPKLPRPFPTGTPPPLPPKNVPATPPRTGSPVPAAIGNNDGGDSCTRYHWPPWPRATPIMKSLPGIAPAGRLDDKDHAQQHPDAPRVPGCPEGIGQGDAGPSARSSAASEDPHLLPRASGQEAFPKSVARAASCRVVEKHPVRRRPGCSARIVELFRAHGRKALKPQDRPGAAPGPVSISAWGWPSSAPPKGAPLLPGCARAPPSCRRTGPRAPLAPVSLNPRLSRVSPQSRPFSPPMHSSSPPPVAPLARAESTSSISSTNSLSAATTPTVENEQPSLVWFDRGKFYLTFEGKFRSPSPLRQATRCQEAVPGPESGGKRVCAPVIQGSVGSTAGKTDELKWEISLALAGFLVLAARRSSLGARRLRAGSLAPSLPLDAARGLSCRPESFPQQIPEKKKKIPPRAKTSFPSQTVCLNTHRSFARGFWRSPCSRSRAARSPRVFSRRPRCSPPQNPKKKKKKKKSLQGQKPPSLVKQNAEQQRILWKIPDISQKSENGGKDERARAGAHVCARGHTLRRSPCPRAGVGSLLARFQLAQGPSSPAALALQFTSEGSTLSGCDIELLGPGYRFSLVKKRFAAGECSRAA
ncbi:SGIP1 protein, partial [Crypturellus soui]|nr:SGIP1 protein [Crypturellus soui]